MSMRRHAPAAAPPHFVALERWEVFVPWLFRHTANWPRRLRVSLTQRVEGLALQILDDLVTARHERRRRVAILKAIDLRLQRLRHLLRVAVALQGCSKATREKALGGIDEVGRMLGGWRRRLMRGAEEAVAATEAAT